MILRHLFSPPNNTRLTNLCGPMDEHLRTIETALQVAIAHRHEQFKVDGPKEKARRGMEMLQALYEIAERPIDTATVQLMLAGDSRMNDAQAFAARYAAFDRRAVIGNLVRRINEMLGVHGQASSGDMP